MNGLSPETQQTLTPAEALMVTRTAISNAIWELETDPLSVAGLRSTLEKLRSALASTQSCALGNCNHQACARERVAKHRVERAEKRNAMTERTDTSAYTTAEVRQAFLEHIDTMIAYWSAATRGGLSCRERLEGLAFSILSAIDGDAATLPRFILAPNPHPDDRVFHQLGSERWFPENHASTVVSDIAGNLHTRDR